VIVPDFKVSRYYTYYEVSGTNHRDLQDINRIETIPFIIPLHDFLKAVIDPLSDRFGKFIISSGFRGKKLNSRVGGATNSRHTRGLAVDIVQPSWDYDDFETGIEDIIIFAVKEGLPFHRIIIEKRTKPRKRWLHISGGTTERKIFLGVDGKYEEKKIKIC